MIIKRFSCTLNHLVMACFAIVLICSPVASTASAHTEFASTGIVVDASWLSDFIDDNRVIVIDTRPEEAYLAGHVPGAINIPVQLTFNPDYDEGRVANLQHIRELFSEAGITYGKTYILYDDSSHIDAGRMFWVMELYGHQHVKLLNGGFPAWQKIASSSTEARMLPRSRYVPRIDARRLATRANISMALSDRDKVIIDARDEDEFVGKRSIAKRAGHVPGAINIPWKEAFYEKDGIKMLKGDDELREIYDGVINGRRTYTYCNKGKQSSLTYTLLRQLGHDVAHYDGSWYEWGNNLSLPMRSYVD